MPQDSSPSLRSDFDFAGKHLLSRRGIEELNAYLDGPVNRKTTLAGSWPVTVAEIADPDEFRRDFFPASTKKETLRQNFPGLSRQFEALAAECTGYLDPAANIYLDRKVVEPGELHIKGWHVHGPFLVRLPADAPRMKVLGHQYAPWVYGSGIDFAPGSMIFQAALELPMKCAGEIKTEFPKNIFLITRPDGKQVYETNLAALGEWLGENAVIRSAVPGTISAIPVCIFHASIFAEVPTPRTVIIETCPRKGWDRPYQNG